MSDIGIAGGGVILGDSPATPGGSDTEVQYNDGGAFGGSAALTFDDTSTAPVLTVQANSDTAADTGAIHIRRAAANGTSGHPNNASLGTVAVQALDTDGDWHDAARWVVVTNGSNDTDGSYATAEFTVHDGAGGYNTGFTLDGQLGINFNTTGSRNITFDTAIGGDFNVDAGYVEIQAQSTDVIVTASADMILTGQHQYIRSIDGVAELYKTFNAVHASLDMNSLSGGKKTFTFPNYTGTFLVTADALDPGADRLVFWDDSAGTVKYLTPGTNLSITGTTIDAANSAGTLDDLTDVVITTPADNDLLTYDSGTSKWINAAGAGGYTDEQAQDAVGAMVADGTSVGLTYSDAAPSLTANIKIASQAQGDIIYHNGTQWTRLGAGTSGHFLKTQGAGANPTWAAASGGSGALTLITTNTFSAASSVSVDSCFSAAYDHYRLVVQLDSSSDGFVHLRLRASSTDASGSDYYTAQYFLVTTGNAGTGDSQAAATSFRFTYFDPVASKSTANTTAVDVFRPFAAKVTQFLGGSIEVAQDSWALFRFNAAGHDLETSYDGFTIYPASGTFTGQYWVYGYQVS